MAQTPEEELLALRKGRDLDKNVIADLRNLLDAKERELKAAEDRERRLAFDMGEYDGELKAAESTLSALLGILRSIEAESGSSGGDLWRIHELAVDAIDKYKGAISEAGGGCLG